MDSNSDIHNSVIMRPKVATILGQAAWLMSLSEQHQTQPISALQDRIAIPIALQQFRLFSKDDQPIAFLTWASVSEEIKCSFKAGARSLVEEDWRSGPTIMVVDCISPFVGSDTVLARFQDDIQRAEAHAT